MRLARRLLLEWYEPRRRAYPWRRTGDPFAILVSEVMLQQTQAPRVAAAFERFLRRFPSAARLAAAPRSSVLRAWDGLGYNRRAVALWDAARAIDADLNGRLPSTIEGLRALPGVGPYTAAAVASIAFGVPVPAIDTNVRRVVGRVLAGRDGVHDGGIERLSRLWLDRRRPGDWNQAVMDLGREICRRRPRCDLCPLRTACRFAAAGALPGRAARSQPPFAGSFRQVRGDVVRELRSRRTATLATLATATGHPADRVTAAVAALARDRIVVAGRSAVSGSPRGRVRLAD